MSAKKSQRELMKAIDEVHDKLTDRAGYMNLYSMDDAPKDGSIIMINHVQNGLFQARWTKRDITSAPYLTGSGRMMTDGKKLGEKEGWELRNIMGWQFTESDKFTGWTYTPILREWFK